MTDPADLVVAVERPVPSSVPVGRATAIFCFGACYHRHEPVEDLDIAVDGVRHRSAASGMPRPDIGGRGTRGFRSGFWATVPVAARDGPGTIRLDVIVRLADGSELSAPWGRIEVVEREPSPSSGARPERSAPGLIAVCMATFEPDPELFRTQIESLRSQTDDRWICVISDDCSAAEHFESIERIVGADPRFAISRSDVRLGFYRNFERALQLVPSEAELVALCDQDDRWHPGKLEVLRASLGDAGLVYSDQRLTDAEGRVLRATLWKGRSNNNTNLASMLIANTITGAASLFRRELAELALPFPDTPGFQFHDHWLGVLALAAGEVAYVDRPLYDYVQHAGAIFGDVTHGSPSGDAGRKRRWPRLPGPGQLMEAGRAAYFYGYLAREVQAQTLLVRCSDRLTPAKRRALERFMASATSPIAFAWLAGRVVRLVALRTETLGTETQLARGILWRWLPSGDARFPPPGSFNQKRLRRWRARI